MKERPILFSAPMVRALLAGHKTQTRRAVKPQPAEGDSPRWTYVVSSTDKTLEDKHQCSVIDPDGRSYTDRGRETVVFSGRCPYGQPGDRPWVKEAYALVWPDAFPPDAVTSNRIEYRADTNGKCAPGSWPDSQKNDPEAPRWRPSIHMFRWASRITLEIVSVRVERLQDISETDAIAEGVAIVGQCGNGPIYHPADSHVGTPTCNPIYAYGQLWETINGTIGPDSWAANPWVWVVEFRRIKP